MSELNNLSNEELLAELKRRQLDQQDQERQKREDYEATRDQIAMSLVVEAEQLSEKLVAFKQKSYTRMMTFRDMADKYGELRGNSKGGFSIRSSDGTVKVSLERNTRQEYDERANVAEQLIREFLTAMVKKRDKRSFELITSLLQRGDKGDFNPANIQTLISKEKLYEDERWRKAMQLFKEAHNTILISMNVSFYRKSNIDKDVMVPLTFASLPVLDREGTE